MASIALYYPWMHFQDSDWLKLALLSWERIVRLRSREVVDRDSEVVREIRGESDLLQEIVPSRHDLETVAAAFFELLGGEGSAAREEAVRALRAADPALEVSADGELPRVPYRPSPPSQWAVGPHPAVPISQSPPSQWGGLWVGGVGPHPVVPSSNRIDSPFPAGPARRQARSLELLWIYCGGAGTKISDDLRRYFVEAGVARQVDERDPWIGLHPKLGIVYLTALADAVACHNALSPVTDDLRMHKAVGTLDHLNDLLYHPMTPAFQDTRAAYVHLSLRAVIRPERIAAVPVSRLVGFRQRYAAELAAFHAHIDSLATELEQIAAVENSEIAQAHLQALYERATKPQLDELRRALRAFGIESTVGTLGLKVDLGAASGTALGAMAVSGGHPAVGTAAVALTVVPYIAGRLKARRQQRTGSPVAYLLAAERMSSRSRATNLLPDRL
ncbi:DUF6236 family protein [Streptomyces mirabilis]|uniref:DUF6236 family protein n=1 Tax=Streptomyces mirabilis TaxID=68239 RepID=UPI0033B804AC